MNSDLIGMSFSWKQGAGFYVPVKGPAGCECLACDRVLLDLKSILESEKIKKVAGEELNSENWLHLVARLTG